MRNPKTTKLGYITLAGALLFVVGTALTGGNVPETVQTVLLPALTGLGLVAASDGGR
jgi:hypothetical protein